MPSPDALYNVGIIIITNNNNNDINNNYNLMLITKTLSDIGHTILATSLNPMKYNTLM